MIRFLYGDLLWKEIAKQGKKAKRTKAAVAYVTKGSHLALKRGDVLVVDASDGAIASGQTSAAVLSSFLKKGILLFSHAGLHAKVVIADSVLFTSSANLSDSSLSRLLEAGLQTDHPTAVSAAVGMIERLIETSSVIDLAFISRIRNIEVKKHFSGRKSKARTTAKGHRTPITWLIGVHDIDAPKDLDELYRIERGTAKAEKSVTNPRSSTGWIRLGRRDRIREARQGDSIVIIHRQTNAGNPQRVYRHTSVLWVQEEPSCTRVYYEILPKAEKEALSWPQFKKLSKLAGFPSGFSKDAMRKLTETTSDDLEHNWEKVRSNKV